MAYRASGGPYVKTTLDGTSTTTLISAIQTALTGNGLGWTVISGGGTTDVKLQSVAGHPYGSQVRMRITPTNSTVGLRVTNVAETRAIEYSAGEPMRGFVLTVGAGKVYTLIATPWHFAIYTLGSTPAREWIMFEMPWLPSFLSSKITGTAILWSNTIVDNSTTLLVNFRTGYSRNNANNGWILNDQASAHINWNSSNDMIPLFMIPTNSRLDGPRLSKWKDGRTHISDVYIGWAYATDSQETRIRAQMYDSWWYHDTLPPDEIIQIDGMNFQNMMNPGQGGNSDIRGQLLWRIT